MTADEAIAAVVAAHEAVGASQKKQGEAVVARAVAISHAREIVGSGVYAAIGTKLGLTRARISAMENQGPREADAGG